VLAINLGRHNRQIKDVRVEHLASDSIAMSGWTFSQIQNEIFFKLYLFNPKRCGLFGQLRRRGGSKMTL
jgi:hypothetical protein